MRKRTPYNGNNNNMRNNNMGGGGNRYNNNNRGQQPRRYGGGYEGEDLDQVNPRQRKHAQSMKEKFTNQAQDAMRNGDRVLSEYWYQHAEHYARVLNAIDELFAPEPGQHNRNESDGNAMDDSAHAAGEEAPQHDRQQQRPRYQPRNDAPRQYEGQRPQEGRQNDGQRQDRPYQDRSGQDRPRQDRNFDRPQQAQNDRPQGQERIPSDRPQQGGQERSYAPRPRREYAPEGQGGEARMTPEASPTAPLTDHGHALADILPAVSLPMASLPVVSLPTPPASPAFANPSPATEHSEPASDAPPRPRRGRPPLNRNLDVTPSNDGTAKNTPAVPSASEND